MSVPLISFIVPMYNVAVYLETCLQSILRQSVSKEIILVDDGSSDGTLAIAMSYAERHPEIKIIHYHHNRGQSYARNQGLDLARGEYIYCMDSDDTLVGDKLGEMINIAKQQNAQLIRFQSQMEYESEPYQIHSIKIIPSGIADLKDDCVYQMSGHTCLNRMARRAWIPGVCWTLIQRSFLRQHALRFLEGVQAEDQLFYIQLLSCEEDAVLLEFPYVVYRYRIRQNSTISQRSAKYILDHLTISAKIQEWNQPSLFNENMQAVLTSIQERLRSDAYRMFLKADKSVQTQLESVFVK